MAAIRRCGMSAREPLTWADLDEARAKGTGTAVSKLVPTA